MSGADSSSRRSVSARLRAALAAAIRRGDRGEANKIKSELDALTAKEQAVRRPDENRGHA